MRSLPQRLLFLLAPIAALVGLGMPAQADPGPRVSDLGQRFNVLGFSLEFGPHVQNGPGSQWTRAYAGQIRRRVTRDGAVEHRVTRPVIAGGLISPPAGDPLSAQAIARVVALESALVRSGMPQLVIQSQKLAFLPVERTTPSSPRALIASRVLLGDHASLEVCKAGGSVHLVPLASIARHTAQQESLNEPRSGTTTPVESC